MEEGRRLNEGRRCAMFDVQWVMLLHSIEFLATMSEDFYKFLTVVEDGRGWQGTGP